MPPGHGVDAAADDFSNGRPGEHRQSGENSAELHTQIQPQQLDALIGQLDQAAHRHRRQAEEGHEIPEQQLQQQRDLADQGDIGARKTAQQAVSAVAGRTGRDTEQRGQRQTRKDHLEAVQPTDGQRPEIRVGGCVGERCFRQSEPRWTTEPTETETKSRADQVHGEVVDQQSDQGQQQQSQAQLQQQTMTAHQVNGGAIIKPPSSARRLAPRGIATGLSGPRWRS